MEKFLVVLEKTEKVMIEDILLVWL